MATLRFDEINKLYTNFNARIKPTPYIEYFNKMLISDEQKARRVEIAQRLEEVFLFIFSLIETAKRYDYVDYNFITNELRNELKSAVEEFTELTDYMETYIETVSEMIVATTYENIDEFSADDYYLSENRAEFIAENEANSIANYDELQEAVEQGFHFKTWITMRDNRVRASHGDVDSVTIPIDEMFQVGDSEMMYPHDELNAPEECVNCRCGLEFS